MALGVHSVYSLHFYVANEFETSIPEEKDIEEAEAQRQARV